MVDCTYTLKGLKFESYTDLLQYVDGLVASKAIKLDNIDDIVFSKFPAKDKQVGKLKALKVAYTPKAPSKFEVSAMVDGEPGMSNSILNFLDSPRAAIEGRSLVTPMNKEDYLRVESQHIADSRGISLEEATKIVQKNLDNWKKIQDDSLFAHKMFGSQMVWKNEADFVNTFLNDAPESMQSTSLLTKLHGQLKKRYFGIKSSLPDSSLVTNINISAKIKESAEEIFGHIDWMFVGKDGKLHLYLFKTTSGDPNEWSNVKKEKYKYQLAFLQQMLQANKIDAENIELNVIPVLLTYNEDYTKVTDVTVHYPDPYSTRKSEGRYAMHKYERDARFFVHSSPEIEPVTDAFVRRVDDINHAIFPELHIKKEGIARSAKSWILNAPDADPEGVEPLVIKEIGEPGHYYDVIINGKTYPISTKKGKKTNPDILKVVTEHLNELTDNLGYATQRLKDAIQESYSKGYNTFEMRKGIMGRADKLNSVLGKYLKPIRDEDDKVIGHEWELIEDLIDSNILIFRNKDNVLDIITLSTFDLNEVAHFKRGDTILGCHLYKSEYVDLESNYGNIELVRTMTLLNEIIPQLSGFKLGNVGVLSSVGNFAFILNNIGDFSKRHYYKIIDAVNNLNNDIKILKNLQTARFASDLEMLTQEYLSIVESKDNSDRSFYEQLGFGELQNLESLDEDGKDHRYIKSLALLNILRLIQSTYSFDDINYYNLVKDKPGRTGQIARLYDMVAKAYFSLTGQEIVRSTEYNNIETTFTTPDTIDNQNIQYIANNLLITYDTIASEFDTIYEKDIRKPFSKFYKGIGYGAAQNMSIGNLAGLFNNLYDMSTMTFKNPYDMSNNLNTHERELLKTVLYQFAQISAKGNFKLSVHDDPAIATYIENHPEYLWVPLERASKATARSSKDRITAKIKNGFKRLKQVEDRMDEYVNGVMKEERDLIGNDSDEFYTFSLKNPFSMSTLMGGSYTEIKKSRLKMIAKYGPEFFETNLENLLIDYLVQSIKTQQLQKFMVVSKAFMLRMHLTGNMGGNTAVVNKEIKYIEDYLKINVFKSSIMSKHEKAVISAVMPLKNFATNVLIGGNVIGYVRDMFLGLEENFMRTLTKLNTDIDSKSVAAAYTYVFKHARSNAMAVNLLGKLCSKYRLSNTDVGRIGERYKTGRNGILNYDNFLYGTMRSPDFYNRMVLFVAKCMRDGVWDAYSIDKQNNLVYDWKKDTRFSLYANPNANKNSEEYKKQKALYLSKLREYYEEHPEIALQNDNDMTIDLPSPYSLREIKAIRAVGDNIYGAYDKSKKAMAEFHSLGICFAMFTTWMNGIINNYFMKPQRNGVSKLIEELEIDENGNKLWFAEDGSITTENTGVPVLKFVPPIVMGIFPTIGILASMCKDKGFKTAWTYMNSNPVMKANMRKLLSDLLVSLLLAGLFKLALDPAYKEHKKEAKADPMNNPVMKNLAVEILYKGSGKSYDTFKGLFNIIDFVGSNSATPIYSVPSELIHNAVSFVTDSKDFGTIFTTQTGIGRSFRDTYKLYRTTNQQS